MAFYCMRSNECGCGGEHASSHHIANACLKIHASNGRLSHAVARVWMRWGTCIIGHHTAYECVLAEGLIFHDNQI